MFMFTTTRNGVAAKAVERQIGVTYKTAWRMCHQIREYMGAVDGNGPLGGFIKQVEVDETIIGGKTTAEERRRSGGSSGPISSHSASAKSRPPMTAPQKAVLN